MAKYIFHGLINKFNGFYGQLASRRIKLDVFQGGAEEPEEILKSSDNRTFQFYFFLGGSDRGRGTLFFCGDKGSLGNSDISYSFVLQELVPVTLAGKRLVSRFVEIFEEMFYFLFGNAPSEGDTFDVVLF